MLRIAHVSIAIAGLLVALPFEISGFVLEPAKGKKSKRWHRLEMGQAPGPSPKLERGAAVNGHWVKEAGKNGSWHHEAGNVYRKVAGVGKSGGRCTCPDGEVYEVGAFGNDCTHLACEGGEASECSKHGISRKSHGMMVTCVRAPLAEAGAALGAKHHSIFQVHLESLDNTDFYAILIFMLVFAVCIDQGQKGLNYLSSKRPPLRYFLSRVYGELMLFGIVAFASLIIENCFGDIDEGKHQLVEFVVILCAVSAMSLILLAGATVSVFFWFETHWIGLEHAKPPFSEETVSYLALADHFRYSFDLPSTFEFWKYLKRVFLQECVTIMSVQWLSWLFFALLPLSGYVYRKYRDETLPDALILDMITYANWGVLMLHVTLFAVAHFLYVSIDECMSGDATAWSPNVIQGVQFLMNLVVVMNSFFFGLYLMTCIYNAQFSDKPGYFVAMDGVPLVVDIVILVPGFLSYFAPVKAFFAADADLIAEILEQDAQALEDLAYLRKAWSEVEHKAPGNFLTGDSSTINLQTFKRHLKELHIHMTSMRVDRLFDAIDENRSGEISEEEFRKVLGVQSQSSRQSPRSDPPGT